MAEGRLVVERLLSSSYATRSVMVTQAAGTAIAASLERHPDLPVYEVSQDVMNGVTGVNMHRGCLAVGVRPEPAHADTLRADAGVLIALEGVGNADNVGSIFRNAAAFGVRGVLLDDRSADPLYRKALRTSMGASLQVPFVMTSSWLDTLSAWRRDGATLVALTPSPDAPALAGALSVPLGRSLVLVAGHEGSGLSAAALAASGIRARIPMEASVDSLNVATALAIALYELRRVPRTAR